MDAYRHDGSPVVRSGRSYETRQQDISPVTMVPDDSNPALLRARDLSRETGRTVRAIILRD